MDNEIEVVAEVAGARKPHKPHTNRHLNQPVRSANQANINGGGRNINGPSTSSAGVFKVPQNRRVMEEERRQEIQSAKQALQQCVRLHEELEDEELDLAQEDAAEQHMNKIQQLEVLQIFLPSLSTSGYGELDVWLQRQVNRSLAANKRFYLPTYDEVLEQIGQIKTRNVQMARSGDFEGLAQRTMEMVTRLVRQRRGMETLMSLEEIHDIWYEKAIKKTDMAASDLIEYVEEDPADSDPALRAKLAANHRHHVHRLERVQTHLNNIIDAGTIDDGEDDEDDDEGDDIIYEDSVSQGQQAQK